MESRRHTIVIIRALAASLQVALLCLTVIPFALSQVNPSGQSEQTDDITQGTVSTDTDLVLVPAQVRGTAGKSVHGLQRSDFVLRSDGKLQIVKVLEEYDAATENPKAETVNPLANSQEFSNVPEGGMPEHLLIIAIDEVNSPTVEQGWAQRELNKYLAKAAPNQPTALLAITRDGLVQIHAPSSDPKVLLRALQSEHARLAEAERNAKTRRELGLPETGLSVVSDEAGRESIQASAIDSTLRSFDELERAYLGVPGRKSLILLSDKMPYLPEIAAILNRGNIALYPVNLGGIKSDAHFMADAPSGDPIDPQDTKMLDDSPTSGEDNGMRELAARTGGRSCQAMIGLRTCIDEAVDDSASYYLLGFYVSRHDRTLGWHKLQVKLVSGRDTVYARSAFYLEPKIAPTQKEVVNDLITAANATVAYTGIEFYAQQLVESAASPKSSGFIRLRIRVPASSVMSASGRHSLSYEIAAVLLSEKGKPTTNAQTFRLDLNQQQSDIALSHGWQCDEALSGRDSLAAVKLIVREDGTGRIGSLILPVCSSDCGDIKNHH